MGDLKVFLPRPNGSLGNGSPTSSPLPMQSLNPRPNAIGSDAWQRAEQVTQRIIRGIQPNPASDKSRRRIIEYVQTLLKGSIGCEVFVFGSVPLNTYLPDGDIDLTAFGPPNFESTLANDVRAVLEGEEQNNASSFEVKDVQYIHAEVKLVKFIVQNIIVDISFSQIGGLSTLCFLEHVDHLVGKNHLFKRSIILIKAWCYYESRILGAHHGLISTYALETLVLCIFHLFHSSLDGPLAVLYRFLDYFGKFDWDNYCISLRGPVSLSSGQEIVAEASDSECSSLLFTPEFLKQSVELYSVPPRGFEKNSNFRTFSVKHLNIIDPLRDNNNLGRSVSKGSFYRIRSAFAYGARKLGRILLLPGEDIEDELNKFFMNTLDMHGSGERPDVQDAPSTIPETAVSDFDVSGSVLSNGESVISEVSSVDSPDELSENLNSTRIRGLEKENETGLQPGRQECDHHLRNCLCRDTKVESNGFREENVALEISLAGDVKGLATSRPTDTIDKSSSRNAEMVEARHAPHLFIYKESGEIRNGNHDQLKSSESGTSVKEVTYAQHLTTDEDISLASGEEPYCTEFTSSEMLHFYGDDRVFDSFKRKNGPLISSESTCSSENLNPTACSLGGSKGIQDPGSIESTLGQTSNYPETYGSSELSSDYNTHFGTFRYARTAFYDHEYMVGWPFIPMQPPSPHFYQKSWDAFHRQNPLPQMNVNGAIPRPHFPPPAYIQINPNFMPARGTGTYFPNTSYHSYRGRRQPPRSRNNGRAMMPPEANMTNQVGQGQPPQASVFSGNEHGKSPMPNGLPQAVGSTSSPSGRLEFGSFGPAQVPATSLKSDKNLEADDPHNQGSVDTSMEDEQGTNLN